MKIKIKLFFCVVGIFLAFGSVVIAGSIRPSSSPVPSTHTLSDIYNKLINNLYTANILNSFDFPTGEASSTMHTVEEIWNAIPTISSSTIISGNTILGIAGTYNVSSLTPSGVASGTVYGTSSVGTMLSGNPLYTRPALEISPVFGPMNWASSTSYCSQYLVGTSTHVTNYPDPRGWRLPTLRELEFIINETPVSGEYFVSGRYYWSSSESITDLNNLLSLSVWRVKVLEGEVLFEFPPPQAALKTSGTIYFFCVK